MTTYIQGNFAIPLVPSSLVGVRPITVGWKPGSSSGCIFYTSFHIEGASTGSDQEKALKYLILNANSLTD